MTGTSESSAYPEAYQDASSLDKEHHKDTWDLVQKDWETIEKLTTTRAVKDLNPPHGGVSFVPSDLPVRPSAHGQHDATSMAASETKVAT